MKITSLVIMMAFISSAWSQYIISANYINTTPQIVLASVANLPLEYDVETYKIVYNTVDALGNPTIASGAFCFPISEDCSNFQWPCMSTERVYERWMSPLMMYKRRILVRFFLRGDIML